MLGRVYGAQITGLDAQIIDIEVDTSRGLHSFTIVGLPDKACEEARERITAAVKNSGLPPLVKGSRKIMVSLAPADIRKEGSSFDLPIAVASLIATGDVAFPFKGKLFLGELSLTGEIRSTRGVLRIAEEARQKGFTEIYLPKINAVEASLIEGITVFPCNNLRELINHLSQSEDFKIPKEEKVRLNLNGVKCEVDFSDIRGQENAKRGLEIAAAGGHNVAMTGPPGTGKTLLAKAFSGILPPVTFSEVLEITGIHSAAGISHGKIITSRPIRSPHHTSSYVACVGGGIFPRPGEITLAHRGVLFLDEFPEFERRVIESLRQPLEEKFINVSRARGTSRFPAHFILIAAMNLCPCGNTGIPAKECLCNPSSISKYERKMSGPISDRIDMWLSVPHINHYKLSERRTLESSNSIQKRIIKARSIQKIRFGEESQKVNSDMTIKDLDRTVNLKGQLQNLLNESAEKLSLSARGHHKVIKLARTIADLEGEDDISEDHILEALQYRNRNSN